MENNKVTLDIERYNTLHTHYHNTVTQGKKLITKIGDSFNIYYTDEEAIVKLQGEMEKQEKIFKEERDADSRVIKDLIEKLKEAHKSNSEEKTEADIDNIKQLNTKLRKMSIREFLKWKKG